MPTINALLDPSSAHCLGSEPSSRIAGFASLNYRLSPHPAFAQDLSCTPSFGTRTARHPDHLVDILSGLRFLQKKFGFGKEYVFFGHSAGGFVNYQILLGRTACLGGVGGDRVDTYEDVELPVAVVGFEGIYDLAGLNVRMKGTYTGFMEAAFGPNTTPSSSSQSEWDIASPAINQKGNFKRDWFDKGGKIAVLAQSATDELVDMAECDIMEKRLREDGVGKVLVFRDLVGGHFEVLRDGSFARVLKITLEELDKL